jgi:hypothetical protein
VHIWANLGNNDLRDTPRHTRDRVESVQHCFKRALTLFVVPGTIVQATISFS